MSLVEELPDRSGYLLKDRVSEIGSLPDALRRIGDGECVIDPTIVSRLVSHRRNAGPLAELTAREREVLALMAEGHFNRGKHLPEARHRRGAGLPPARHGGSHRPTRAGCPRARSPAWSPRSRPTRRGRGHRHSCRSASSPPPPDRIRSASRAATSSSRGCRPRSVRADPHADRAGRKRPDLPPQHQPEGKLAQLLGILLALPRLALDRTTAGVGTCRTSARSSALIYPYGRASSESAEPVLARAESDGVPFVRSAECRIWVEQGLRELYDGSSRGSGADGIGAD